MEKLINNLDWKVTPLSPTESIVSTKFLKNTYKVGTDNDKIQDAKEHIVKRVFLNLIDSIEYGEECFSVYNMMERL